MKLFKTQHIRYYTHTNITQSQCQKKNNNKTLYITNARSINTTAIMPYNSYII